MLNIRFSNSKMLILPTTPTQSIKLALVLNGQKSQDKCGLFQYSNAPLLFQFYKVLAGFIKNDGKQMSQVVRKYFGWRHAPVFTKAFQFRPDLLAGQFFSAFATKDGAGGSFSIFVTFEQLAAQLAERRITRIPPFTHDGVRVLFI